MKKLSKCQIKKAKKLIQKISDIHKRNQFKTKITPIYDEAYFKALEYMEKN